jgi:hypothetical protein
MTGFEHLQVLISVVAGLALTNLLSGIGSTLKGHQPLYWVQGLWALNLAIFIVLFWWFTFTDFAGIESFHPFAYLFVLLFAFSLYLPTRVLFPDPSQPIDLRSHFFAVRGVFFRLMLLVAAVDICDTYVKHGIGYAAPEAEWFVGIKGPYAVWMSCQVVGHWLASRSESGAFQAGWAIFYLSWVLFWLTTLSPLGNT